MTKNAMRIESLLSFLVGGWLSLSPLFSVVMPAQAASPNEEGLILYDETQAEWGYTLFAPSTSAQQYEAIEDAVVYLIDMNGVVVHEWHVGQAYGLYGKLFSNGDLLLREDTNSRPSADSENTTSRWVKLDWDGNELWSYEAPQLHHDASPKFDQELFVIFFEEMSDEALAQVDMETTHKKSTKLWTDRIALVNPETGEELWSWHLQEELPIEEYPFTSEGNEWSHVNSVEYLPDPNIFSEGAAILFSARALNTVFAISYPEGEIMWKYTDGLVLQHAATLLENGHVLLFNNGTKQSEILEIDPTLNEIVWSYTDNDFFSRNTSGAQRLANGNTFVTEGETGRLFEVTPEGNIVWEYRNPYHEDGGKSIFKAYRYAPGDIEWPDASLNPNPEETPSEDLEGEMKATPNLWFWGPFLLATTLVAGTVLVVFWQGRQESNPH